jgi:hypothetical protein
MTAVGLLFILLACKKNRHIEHSMVFLILLFNRVLQNTKKLKSQMQKKQKKHKKQKQKQKIKSKNR